MTDLRPLADPFTNALRSRQSDLAQSRGRMLRFRPDVSVFYGHPPVLTDRDWADLADLADGATVSLRDLRQPLPDDWQLVETFALVQYSGEAIESAGPDDAPDIVELTDDDVDDMLALVHLTKPGPFTRRTIDLGRYVGVRDDDGTLVAMAGERLKVPGWTEVSAVCTSPAARGRGLASTLIRAVAVGVRSAGDEPFLHTTAHNPARKLYESMGFVLRSEVPLIVVRQRRGAREVAGPLE